MHERSVFCKWASQMCKMCKNVQKICKKKQKCAKTRPSMLRASELKHWQGKQKLQKVAQRNEKHNCVCPTIQFPTVPEPMLHKWAYVLHILHILPDRPLLRMCKNVQNVQNVQMKLQLIFYILILKTPRSPIPTKNHTENCTPLIFGIFRGSQT